LSRWLMFFFFSSRRRHTRLQGDWSSDVCSSDLEPLLADEMRALGFQARALPGGVETDGGPAEAMRLNLWLRTASRVLVRMGEPRSEERRVGKECRSRWSPYH